MSEPLDLEPIKNRRAAWERAGVDPLPMESSAEFAISLGSRVDLIRQRAAASADDVLSLIAEVERLLAEATATAEWVLAMGYPYDFGSDAMPPEHLRRALAEVAVNMDGFMFDGATVEDAYAFLAEEGRWES